jgi:hypothetical protein
LNLMPLPVVRLGPAVAEGRELGAEAPYVVKVEGCQSVSIAVGTGRKNCAPGVYDHAPPVCLAPVGLLAPLGWD